MTITVYLACVCVFLRGTQSAHSFSGTLFENNRFETKTGWCRLVDGHLANEGKFTVHVFFYSWLMPSENRKSRHILQRWLAADDDRLSAHAHEVLIGACRSVGMQRNPGGETTWNTDVSHNCVTDRYVFRFYVCPREVYVKGVFCVCI